MHTYPVSLPLEGPTLSCRAGNCRRWTGLITAAKLGGELNLTRVANSSWQLMDEPSGTSANEALQLAEPQAPESADLDELAGVILLISAGMFAYFIVLNVSGLVPLQILDPVWVLSAIGSLYSSILCPLLAVCLIILLVILRPGDPRPRRWLARCRRLSLVVVAGFLLLIPLQISAITRLTVLQEVPATRTLSLINSVIVEASGATTVPQLAALISKLPDAPQLPASLTNATLSPFKEQLIAELNRNFKLLEAEQREARRKRSFDGVVTAIKGTTVCLLFALVFAGLAQRDPSNPSVLGGFLMQRATRRERSEQRRQERLNKQQEQRRDREQAMAMKDFRQMAEANRQATERQIDSQTRRQAAPHSPGGKRRWLPGGWGGSNSTAFGPTFDQVDPYLSRLAALNEADAAAADQGEEKKQNGKEFPNQNSSTQPPNP